MMVWTAVVEDTTTGVIQTPVFHGMWSGKKAYDHALSEYAPEGEDKRVICLIKGIQDQNIYYKAGGTE